MRHQNSLYEATVPVALYIAAILSHPATATVGPGRRGEHEPNRPTRAAMLDWLGSLAYDADDECVVIGERHFNGGYLDDYPQMRAFRDLRPVFYGAVSPFLAHVDTAVRDAALIAALPLAEHPGLTHHRDELACHARGLLTTSTSRYNRNRALDALRIWGHNTAALETPADTAARNRRPCGADPWAGGFMDDPPF